MSGIKKPLASTIPPVPAKDAVKHDTVIANAPSRGPAAPSPASTRKPRLKTPPEPLPEAPPLPPKD